MLWMNGIAVSAWQALFNPVPAERRDQVRAFINGVPSTLDDVNTRRVSGCATESIPVESFSASASKNVPNMAPENDSGTST